MIGNMFSLKITCILIKEYTITQKNKCVFSVEYTITQKYASIWQISRNICLFGESDHNTYNWKQFYMLLCRLHMTPTPRIKMHLLFFFSENLKLLHAQKYRQRSEVYSMRNFLYTLISILNLLKYQMFTNVICIINSTVLSNGFKI